ncbi:MAG: hypothetical protein WCE68_02260 [Anaerolineales bacterium]
MKTKKFIFPLLALIAVLVIVLAACGAKSSTPTAQTNGGFPGANGTPGAGFAAFNTRPLPPAESLLVGMYKLQGTSNALTPTQAAALVPLWQAYAQLTSSNTAAQAEIDAVTTQIQQTLTPAQVQAITAMKLTRADLATTMTSLGITNGGANGTPGFRFTPGAGGGRGGGGFFVGGGGGGGGIPGGGGTTTRPTPNATALAYRAMYANRIPTALMNAIIAYLQKTAGS